MIESVIHTAPAASGRDSARRREYPDPDDALASHASTTPAAACPAAGLYHFELSGGRFLIDAFAVRNVAAFINFSCDPNLEPRRLDALMSLLPLRVLEVHVVRRRRGFALPHRAQKLHLPPTVFVEQIEMIAGRQLIKEAVDGFGRRWAHVHVLDPLLQPLFRLVAGLQLIVLDEVARALRAQPRRGVPGTLKPSLWERHFAPLAAALAALADRRHPRDRARLARCQPRRDLTAT